MTTSELSIDAMREIKSRRDSLASQHTKDVDDEAKRIKLAKKADGVRAFMAWFGRQRQSQGVVMASQHMLDVQKSVSDRFSVGLLDMRYFIAIPEDCRDWFFEMPWLHAAIGRDNSVISLVCARSQVPDVTLPEFSLNFDTGVPAMLKMMSNYHYLDVRLITGAPTQLSGGRRAISVSKEVHMTLDIRVISGERTFANLLDGRRPNGLDSRSVTTAKAPTRQLKPLDIDPPRTPLLSAGKAR
jgi:hypothetical protein